MIHGLAESNHILVLLFVSMENMLPLIFFKMTQATYGCPIMIKTERKLLLLQMEMNGNPMLMQLLH